MATNSVNLGRGNGDGMFYHAAENTALPAYPTASLASAWSEVGSVGEDGITWALARDLDTIKNWAKKIERMLPSDDSETVQAPLISTTAEVMSVLFGEDAVTEETATTQHGNLFSVDVENDTIPGKEAFLFIGKDGDDTFMLGTTSGQLQAIDDADFDPANPITWTATFAADKWTFMKDDGQLS